MRKIILAPDSFKGTLSAEEVCQIWRIAAERHMPDAVCVSLPLSDGGDGLIDAIRDSVGGEDIVVTVSDPLGRKREAGYLILPDGTAVIEMAAASGLTLLAPEERDPMCTSSYGTGELIVSSIERGAKHVILGLGGSATNDAGLGAAVAMGLKLVEDDGTHLGVERETYRTTVEIDSSEYRKCIEGVHFSLICDVSNPLCGPLGATVVYGPQKGATEEQVLLLDRELSDFSSLLAKDSGRSCSEIPGCGAAGGFALPLLSYGDVVISSGIEMVMDILEFDNHLNDTKLVITGEGRTDEQSSMGKVIFGVAKRAGAKRVPVVVLSGALLGGIESLFDAGVTAMFSACTGPASIGELLSASRKNLESASENLFRLLNQIL